MAGKQTAPDRRRLFVCTGTADFCRLFFYFNPIFFTPFSGNFLICPIMILIPLLFYSEIIERIFKSTECSSSDNCFF